MKIKQYILYIYNWIYEKKIKISDKILKRKIGVPQILTIDETIDYIIKDNISVSRYGDGEMKIVSGERIRFQEYDVNLSEKLRKKSCTALGLCSSFKVWLNQIRWYLPRW